MMKRGRGVGHHLPQPIDPARSSIGVFNTFSQQICRRIVAPGLLPKPQIR
jgi:hypothetical protein